MTWLAVHLEEKNIENVYKLYKNGQAYPNNIQNTGNMFIGLEKHASYLCPKVAKFGQLVDSFFTKLQLALFGDWVPCAFPISVERTEFISFSSIEMFNLTSNIYHPCAFLLGSF